MLAKPWWSVPASSSRRATALQALQVFQARSKSGHRVAIKHMPCKPGAKLTSIQRRDVDVLRKIHRHPNVVHLQEVNMTGFGVELAFDLADSTLRDCIKGGAVSPVRVSRYAMGLFNGLTFLHSNGIYAPRH